MFNNNSLRLVWRWISGIYVEASATEAETNTYKFLFKIDDSYIDCADGHAFYYPNYEYTEGDETIIDNLIILTSLRVNAEIDKKIRLDLINKYMNNIDPYINNPNSGIKHVLNFTLEYTELQLLMLNALPISLQTIELHNMNLPIKSALSAPSYTYDTYRLNQLCNLIEDMNNIIIEDSIKYQFVITIDNVLSFDVLSNIHLIYLVNAQSGIITYNDNVLCIYLYIT